MQKMHGKRAGLVIRRIVLFSIINSLNTLQYICLILIVIFISILSLFTLKESQKTWKWLIYILIFVEMIFLSNRIIHDKMPDTILAGCFHIITLISFVVLVFSIFIIGYFANRKK